MAKSYLQILYPRYAGKIEEAMGRGVTEDNIAFDIERRRDTAISLGYRPGEVDAALGMTPRGIVESQRFLDGQLADVVSKTSDGDVNKARATKLLQTMYREGAPRGLIVSPTGRRLLEGLGEEGTQGEHYFAREMSYEFQGRDGVVDRLGPQKNELGPGFKAKPFDYTDANPITRFAGGFFRGVDTFVAGVVFNSQDWLLGNEQAGAAAKRILTDVANDRATDESMVGQIGELMGTSSMFLLAGYLIGGALGGATGLQVATKAPLGYAGVGGGIVTGLAESNAVQMFASAMAKNLNGTAMGVMESVFEGGMAFRAVEDATSNREQAYMAAASVFWQNLGINMVIDNVTWFGNSEFMRRATAPLENSPVGRFLLRYGATYGTEMVQESAQNMIAEHNINGTSYADMNWLETFQQAGIPMAFSTLFTRGIFDYAMYRSDAKAAVESARGKIEQIDIALKTQGVKAEGGEVKPLSDVRQPIAEMDDDGELIHHGWASEQDAAKAEEGESTVGTPVGLHGTKKGLSEVRPTYETHQSKNLYGPGFYVTDNNDVADGYAGKGKASSGKVYEVFWKGDTPPNLLNLEEKLPAGAAEKIQDAVGDLIEVDGEKTGKVVYEEVKRAMKENDYTRDDADEVLDAIADNLKDAGFDGLSHIGGEKTGGVKHNVSIFFDPENNIAIKEKGKPVPPSPSAEAPAETTGIWAKEPTGKKGLPGGKLRNEARSVFASKPDTVIADVMASRTEKSKAERGIVKQMRKDLKTWKNDPNIHWENRNSIQGLHEDLQVDSRPKVSSLIERHSIAEEQAEIGRARWAEEVKVREQAKQAVVNAAVASAPVSVNEGEIWSSEQEAKSHKERKGPFGRRMLGALLGVSRAADQMDGKGSQYTGPIHRTTVENVAQASGFAQVKVREIKTYFDEVMKRFGVTQDSFSAQVQIGDQAVRKADLMYYWYGARNDEQAERLIHGNQLGRTVGDVETETTRDLADKLIAIADEKLSDGEKQVALHVGKVLDALFPKIAETARKFDNVDPGQHLWYLPMKEGAQADTVGLRLDFDEKKGGLTTNAVSFFGRSNRGRDYFTKARSGAKSRPIKTNLLEVMYRDIPDMIRYVEMREALEYAAGVINNPEFRSAARRMVGERGMRDFDHFVREEANPGYMNKNGDIWDSVSRTVRSHATTMYLFGNLMTVMKQAPSAVQYFLFAPKEMMGGAVLRAMQEHNMLPCDLALQKSAYMKLRWDHPEQMIYAIDRAGTSKMKDVLTVGMAGIRAVDFAVTSYGWTACYYHALDTMGLSDENAIAWADRITKNTQPDATKSEQPEFYRKEIGRTILAFSNQLNKYFQTTFHDAFESGNGRRIMSQLAIMAITAYLIQAISEGELPTTAKDIARGQGAMAASMLPFGREAVAQMQGYGGEDLLSKIGSESGRIGSHTIKVIDAWYNGDEDYIKDHWVEIYGSLAFAFNLPYSAVKKVKNAVESGDPTQLIWSPKKGEASLDYSRYKM